MSMHLFVRFEPRAGKANEFRQELRRVVEPTRAEAGCIAVDAFESWRGPFTFAIHSQWVDEASFELHAGLPHTVRFLKAADGLLTHEVKGLRTRWIVGSAGAGG